MPQEALQKVYSDYQAKFEVPPFEDFQRLMADPEKRKVVYQDLSSAYEMPSFEDFDKQVNPGTEYPFVGPKLLGAALTGFGQSNIGAEVAKLRGSNIQEMSQFQPSSLSERIAMSAGRLAGDLPSMFAGGLLGTVGGLATGPGAVLGGGAGAFALPRAIEAAQRGETFQEALPEVGKSAALGAGTALTGGIVGKLAPILKVPAEIGALTFGGAGLEGRLPTSDDLIEATTLVYGLKFSNSIARKIRAARSKAAESKLNVDEQLQSIQDIISQEISKRAPTEPEWQIPPEQQAIKQRMLLEAAQDRMLRRSKRGAELLKRDLAVKEILSEPGTAPDVSAETLARMKETPEQLRQERIESDEIEAAISREKSQQRLAAETELLTPVRGAGGKFERRPTDVSSLKEAMAAAAEKSQQAEGLPEALKETLKGLGELFKPGGELRSGVGFSEEALKKAKPHFAKVASYINDKFRSLGIKPNDSDIVNFDKVPGLDYADRNALSRGKYFPAIPAVKAKVGTGKYIVGRPGQEHGEIAVEYGITTPPEGSIDLDYSRFTPGYFVAGGKFLNISETEVYLKAIPEEIAGIYKMPKLEDFDKQVNPETQYSNIQNVIRQSVLGIMELFKSGGELRSGVGFSEEGYQKAKPHFQAAWEAYKAAGRDFRDFASEILEKGGENLRPFLDQFQREQAASVRQNLTQQTTEKVNQASQSKPEERTPGVEDISWLSRIVFTPQRAVSTKLRSGFGKTNIEVNLEHPKAQDITAKVLREDSKTSQTIQNEITHTTNNEVDFYKGISRLPQGLSSVVYSAERRILGTWLQKVISNPVNAPKVPQQYKKTVASLLAHYKLTDAQIKGDPARGIDSYSDLMTAAGATKAQINAGLKKLQLADIRFRAGNNVFRDFKSYLSFVTRHLSMDPVQVQIKRYMKENPKLFPGQIKQTIEEQLLVARGEKSWVEDRVVDGIWKWFGRESYKGFTSFSQLSRRGQANVKLGYRPVSAFVDLAHSVANALIKREGQPFWQSLKRTADFMKSKEGKKFIKDEEEAGSLQIGLDVDYAGRPVPKEALWKPLGLRSASEVGQRQFALSFAYQNALARGMSEPVAREYARRMLHLTQGTYVLSGMRHFMRAPLAKTMFQFKEYIGRTLELMHTFSDREWAEYAIFNLAMSGPRGLVLFAKSIPMLALVGVLDKVEEALNTYKGIGKELVSGLPGAAGADVAAQATLQIAPQPEDAGGVLISDAIKVFKNFILPVLGPGRYLTARAIKEFGGDTLRSIIPEFRNLLDVWDSIVTQDGWVHNNEGKPVYQLNSGWDRVLKTLGASTIEENQLRVAERLKVGFEQKQRDSIKFLLRVAAKDRLTGSDAEEAIQELGKLGIQSQSIENAFKQRLLDPKTRALLKARLSQKARVLEFYEFE